MCEHWVWFELFLISILIGYWIVTLGVSLIILKTLLGLEGTTGTDLKLSGDAERSLAVKRSTFSIG